MVIRRVGPSGPATPPGRRPSCPDPSGFDPQTRSPGGHLPGDRDERSGEGNRRAYCLTLDAELSTVSRRPFLFIDGEGAQAPDGSHVYMMLAGWSEYTGPLVLRNDDDTPLSSVQCIEWLLSLAERLNVEQHPHTFIGFAIGYDIDMILKDVPAIVASAFRSPERLGWYTERGEPRNVPWYGYLFRQYGSQYSFTDAIYGIGAEYRRRTKETRRYIGIWDVWKFFQGSFVNALRGWRVLPDAQLDAMAAMKAKRSAFDLAGYRDPKTRDEITRYCLSECEAGVGLMTKLADTCADLGYPLARYDGAGSLAAAMLKAWDILDYMDDTPEDMTEAVSSAYFGGRFEIGVHGRVRSRVSQDDINSAYPYQIAALPCLAHATWTRSKHVQREGLYRVRWEIPAPCHWGPLPHRADDGTITFPRIGHGWYWGVELLSAMQLYPGCFSVREGWRLTRGCDDVPFDKVPGVYLERQRLGKSEAGIALKLGLNSLYGKMAQSVGKPRYACYVWAGMVTAGCRAMILDAIRVAQPEHVLAIATDSVMTDTSIELPRDPAKPLGEWSNTIAEQGVLIIQPGISITYNEEGTPEYKSRGIGKKEFAAHADAAEQAWQQTGVLGRFAAQSNRFVGLKSAVARNRYDQRCRWTPVETVLSYSAGSKRSMPADQMLAFLSDRPSYSVAVDGGETISAPYRRLMAKLEGFDAADFIDEQPAIESELLRWVGTIL